MTNGMKRSFLCVMMLVVSLALVFSSCGGDTQSGGTTAGTTETTGQSDSNQTTTAATTKAPGSTTTTTTANTTATTTAVTTPPDTTVPAPTRDISQYLITHWDFKGSSLTEQLSDKATKGASRDDLVLMGNVKVENGRATVSSEPGAYLYAVNQSDLNSFAELTCFLKFKATGTATGFADFISKSGRDFFRAFINDTKSLESKYFIDCRYKSNISTSWSFQNPQTFDAGQEVFIALTARLDTQAQKVYLTAYKSFDGQTYEKGPERAYDETDAAIGAKTDISADPMAGALIIGKHIGNITKDMGITYDFDDIRIYNRALTLEEIASIRVSS